MKTYELPQIHHSGFWPFELAFHEGRPTATVYFIKEIDVMVDRILETLLPIASKL